MTITIENKIKDRTAKAAVIGLGYVGLPLAVEIAKAGFRTTGIDVSMDRIGLLQAGQNYIDDIDDEELQSLVVQKKLEVTSDFSVLAEQDVISVCVPTPLGKGKNPDMSYIISAMTQVKKYLKKRQTIILESTTYPGTTEEVILPLLNETGLKVGEDFHLAFSPERIDPGNKEFGLRNTPKIVGGITHNCTEIAQSYYQTFVEKVIPVSSTRSAEMVKILENTFRAVNIGLANEIAIMCNHLGVDTWEVVDAASSKPFGFMPFYPGPGLGGHCIPVDPHYLLWKLRVLDYHARFIHLADEINSSMPRLVVEKIGDALNERGKAVKGSKILILGIAYKKDVADSRESPALDIIRLLSAKGAIVTYHDPYIPHLTVHGLDSITSLATVHEYDCLSLLTHHSSYNVKSLVENCQLFVDTRNATKGITGHSGKIVKL